MEQDYSSYSVEMQTEAFDRDFDEIQYEPIEIDDSDEEAAYLYGLK